MAPTIRMIKRRSTGFSLVELVVVIVVLGTIAAIAAPRFGHAANSYRLEAAVQKLEADLRYATQMARTQSRTVTVQFDPGNDSYRILGVEDAFGGATDYIVDLSQPPYQVDLADVRFSGGTISALRINGHGSLINKGVVRIELGPTARLIGIDWTSPAEQEVKVEVVDPKTKTDGITLVVPDGFLK
ncbi:MAG: GspH/FimT family pseudopilin [Phycisphaerales bacterium JB065]